MKFVLGWLATAIAVGVAVWIVPGITTVGPDGTIAVIIGALGLSLVNIALKPVLKLLSLPITIVTLGLFSLVLNALLLQFAAWATTGIFESGISIDGFGSAFIGSIVISIVSSIANGIINKD